MKNIKSLYKRILPLFAAVMVLSMTASAENYIDTGMTGSVTMTMTYDGETADANDGIIEIYRVADISTDEIGEYYYEYTNDFMGCTADLSDPSSSTLPDEFISYIDGNGITAYAKAVPGNGTASFSSLPLGMYLVRQTEASTGYYEFLPFVVTIPTSENGVFSYDVDASPKMEVIVPPTETEIETETEAVPAIPGSPVQTGDYMTYGLLMMLMACVMALALVGIKIRKNKNLENDGGH